MDTLKNYVEHKLTHADKITEAKGYPLVLENCKINKELKGLKVFGAHVDEGVTEESNSGCVGELSGNVYCGNFRYNGNQANSITLKNSGSELLINGYCTNNVNTLGNQDDEIILRAGVTYEFSVTYLSGSGETNTILIGLHDLDTGLWYKHDGSNITAAKTLNTANYMNGYTKIFTPVNDSKITVNVILSSGNFENLKFGIQIKEGTKVTPYEPYGYKIPVIQSGKNKLDFADNDISSATYVEGGDNWGVWKGNVSTAQSQYMASLGWIRFGYFGKTIKIKTGVPITISADVTPLEKHDETRTTATAFTPTAKESNVNFARRTFPLEIGVKSHLVHTFTPSSFDGETLYIIFYLCSHTMKVENFQIEYGDINTDFEPYVEPIHHNIYIASPLAEGEYIDFMKKKMFGIDSEDEVVCNMPKIMSKTTIFETDTSVPPSGMYGKYIKR